MTLRNEQQRLSISPIVFTAVAVSSSLAVAVLFKLKRRDTGKSGLSRNDTQRGASFVPGGSICEEKQKTKTELEHEQGGIGDEDELPLPTAYEILIENGTPLVKLQRVSHMLGRHVYVKMECLNPGGTGKDRAALSMIRRAEFDRLLPPPCMDISKSRDDRFLKDTNGESAAKTNGVANGKTSTSSTSASENKDKDGNKKENDEKENEFLRLIMRAMRRSRSGGLVVEGTSGSTGIALATLCAARGHACLVVLPDDQASEKQRILSALGAVVQVVPNAAISNPKHYVNIARRISDLARHRLGVRAVFCDQFENVANYDVHFRQTGPELYRQCPQMDAFVMSSGTGGTISGIGAYLKSRERVGRSDSIRIVLVDPPGSALYHKIEHGVAYAPQQRERTLRRHRYDTLAEGIGLDRVTRNFEMGVDSIDSAIRVTDQEAVDMAHWLLRVEGLWVGSSSAMNVVGAVRVSRSLPVGSTVVTMICDSGQRHATRFWNRDFIRGDPWNLSWPEDDNDTDMNNENDMRMKEEGCDDRIGASVGSRTPSCLRDVV